MPERWENMRDVFQIVERSDGVVLWSKVGVGFVNGDESITLYLDSVPLNGKLQVRKRKAKNGGKDE